MANYELYQGDGITPIAIAQPVTATWEQAPAGRFVNGATRRARFARVVWAFGPLTATQYGVFVTERPADGLMTFKTYVKAFGGTPAGYDKCIGVMEEIATGTERDDGMIHDTRIEFTSVEVV